MVELTYLEILKRHVEVALGKMAWCRLGSAGLSWTHNHYVKMMSKWGGGGRVPTFFLRQEFAGNLERILVPKLVIYCHPIGFHRSTT